MANIKFTNISKSFDRTDVLKNINFEIYNGEFLVLVGPSGCGKSTSLRLIAGLESPSSGEVYFEDKCMNEIDPSKRDIAMVFQNYALYPHMSIFDNMAFGLKIRNETKEEISSKVNNAAKLLKIEKYLYKKPKELSGGQRQRVALGRAIVRQPKIFLFDEPLSNLDAKLRQEMRVEIKKLHSLLNATMIYVTHDQTEALTMGDRIAVMKDGQIVQLDTPKKLYDFPKNKFVASFIGSPQINSIDGEIIFQNNKKIFKRNNFQFEIKNNHYQYNNLNEGRIDFGLRSEYIYYENIDDNENDLLSCCLKITFIENLGAHTLLHLKFDNMTLIAMHNRDTDVQLGDEINILLDVGRAHFFHIESGSTV